MKLLLPFGSPTNAIEVEWRKTESTLPIAGGMRQKHVLNLGRMGAYIIFANDKRSQAVFLKDGNCEFIVDCFESIEAAKARCLEHLREQTGMEVAA